MVLVRVIGHQKPIFALFLLYLDFFDQLLKEAVYCLAEKLDKIATILLNQALPIQQVLDVGNVLPLVQLDDQYGRYHILIELCYHSFPLRGIGDEAETLKVLVLNIIQAT
jgi:hypothetical protein